MRQREGKRQAKKALLGDLQLAMGDQEEGEIGRAKGGAGEEEQKQIGVRNGVLPHPDPVPDGPRAPKSGAAHEGAQEPVQPARTAAGSPPAKVNASLMLAGIPR